MMWTKIASLLSAILLFLLAADPAVADKRVALVIGNGAYEHVTRLPNPPNDGADVAWALQGLGFTVQQPNDLGRNALRDALAEFSNAAMGSDIAVVYYAGHGMEIDRQNYLIPVDAKLETDLRVRFEAVPLDDVLGALEGVKGIRIVMLDACRNNPFLKSMKITTANRALSRGLSRVEPSVGTLVSFAAKEGTTAADGSVRNSPYTAALLANLNRPGIEINKLFRLVRDDVLATTGGAQEPYTYGSTSGQDLFLKLPSENPNSTDQTAADYQLAERIGTQEAWDAFLVKHGSDKGNFYVDLAKAARELALVVPPKIKPEKTECNGVLLASTGGGAAKCLRPGDEFTDCEQCPKMVVVPAGSFTMGSPGSEQNNEGPMHKVKIGQAFGVGKFEVTRGQYAAFVTDSGHAMTGKCEVREKTGWVQRTTRSFRKPGYEQTDDHPVVCVIWEDAKAYVKWLSKKTGATYRLLSEAEWEYATRAGSQTHFSFGNDDIQLCEFGNVMDNTMRTKFPKDWTYTPCSDGFVYTAPVGSFTANSFGLHDMHGNVWEWVEDCYNDSYGGAPSDGSAWTTGECEYRGKRGGGWFSDSNDARSADRLETSLDYRVSYLGFRIARTLVETK